MSQDSRFYRVATERDLDISKPIAECPFGRGLCPDASGVPRSFMIKVDPWGNPSTHCPLWRDKAGHTYKAGCILENERISG